MFLYISLIAYFKGRICLRKLIIQKNCTNLATMFLLNIELYKKKYAIFRILRGNYPTWSDLQNDVVTNRTDSPDTPLKY